MTLREQQAIFWQKYAMLVTWAALRGTPIVLLSWKRTIAEQTELVKKKLSKRLDSSHLRGLAADSAFLADILEDGTINWSAERYREFGEYAESIGLKWGGRFGDDPATAAIEGWDCGHVELAE